MAISPHAPAHTRENYYIKFQRCVIHSPNLSYALGEIIITKYVIKVKYDKKISAEIISLPEFNTDFWFMSYIFFKFRFYYLCDIFFITDRGNNIIVYGKYWEARTLPGYPRTHLLNHQKGFNPLQKYCQTLKITAGHRRKYYMYCREHQYKNTSFIDIMLFPGI